MGAALGLALRPRARVPLAPIQMRREGLEPSRPRGHGHLEAACLEVGTGGIEPPTSAFVVRCSIQLSHVPGCRGGRIRTCIPLVPNQTRYQVAPHLDGVDRRFDVVMREGSRGTAQGRAPRRWRPCVRRSPRRADIRGCRPRPHVVRLGRHRGNLLRAATRACLRPDRGVYRLGRRRGGRRSAGSMPASGRTGSGRPARSWNWSVDPWMWLAVVILLPSRQRIYACFSAASSIHRRSFECRYCPRPDRVTRRAPMVLARIREPAGRGRLAGPRPRRAGVTRQARPPSLPPAAAGPRGARGGGAHRERRALAGSSPVHRQTCGPAH